MSYRPSKPALRRLTALAQTQGGYFTAKQAAEIGYDYPHLDYHVRAGNFIRAGHGVYRLSHVVASEHDDLIRLAFWSRDRGDNPQAVASHETALAIHGLSDVLPSRTHLTVPPKFRKPGPKGTVLHRGILAPHEVEEREGFLITTPLRTLLDVANETTVPDEQLHKAIVEALERGLVRRSKLTALAKKLPLGNKLSRSFADAS